MHQGHKVNIRDYLKSNGFRFTEQGINYVFNCPFCDDDRSRFGINKETGAYRCFNCENRGKSINSFQKKLGSGEKLKKIDLEKSEHKKEEIQLDQNLHIKCHERVRNSERLAYSYLRKERGFSKDTINYFQLGSKIFKSYEYVSIPYVEGGKLVNIKFRGINHESKTFKWRRIPGGKSSLFNDRAIDDFDSQIFIVEAELDAVALWNAGYKNVISVTTGAKGFNSEWYLRLKKFDKIYIVFDNDVDGQDGALKISKRLGINRCFNVVLPEDVKDINEFFWDAKNHKINHSRDDFEKLIQESKQFRIKDVVSLKEALHELYKNIYMADEDQLLGFSTPWESVNKILGGVKPGYFNVVTANPKSGKTSLVLDWIRYLANEEDVPCFIYCCEMRQARLAAKYVAMQSADYQSEESITKTQIFETSYKFNSKNIFFGYPKEDVLDLDSVCEKIKEVVEVYGVRFVCFDNLHFLVRGDGVKDKIGEVTRRFKLLAETLDIVFVLIVHPRKLGHKGAPTPDDLKDSSSIFQDLDNLIILHREIMDNKDMSDASNFGKMQKITEVQVISRWGEGGKAYLHFNGKRCTFKDKGTTFNKAMKAYIDYKKSKMKRNNK